MVFKERKRFSVLFFFALWVVMASAQISGRVVDAKTGEALPFLNIFYKDGKMTGTSTDVDGRYTIESKHGNSELVFSFVGYKSQIVKVNATTRQLNVKMVPEAQVLEEVKVKARKKKYVRKNNPAVELMKKVIAARKTSDLKLKPYYKIDKYEKMTLSVNEFSPKVFEDGRFKKLSFLKDHAEVCPETGKVILPLTVDETVSEEVHSLDPKLDKTIITGQRSEGVNDLINTGDILTVLMKDCFTEVDIYDEHVRLFQYPLLSPVANTATSFYRYYINDTIDVEGDKCFHLSFTPNNQQDFGFSGELFVLADSSYQLKQCILSLPKRSDVNFVEELRVKQIFEQLPSGDRVIKENDMLVQLKLASFLNKFQAQRITRYNDYSFDTLPNYRFKMTGKVIKMPNAQMRDEAFWTKVRPLELTHQEKNMGGLLESIQNIKGFKYIIIGLKALIENFVETSKGDSKVDIGPINTMLTQNYIDGVRLRASAQTTANLNPHWFFKGYGAYGFKDHRWKGSMMVNYSFNKKDYLPREFPVNNLSLTYYNDVTVASDKFVQTDKDNVFSSFKFQPVRHLYYDESWLLNYEREWENGLRITTHVKREEIEPCGRLFYQHLGGSATPSDNLEHRVNSINTSDLFFGIRYQPGATYVNTKQRRLSTNFDSPIFALSHTVSPKGFLGSSYVSNFTEAEIYKRFWFGSWGKMDVQLKAGAQWNKVPAPLLIVPAADLSYIKHVQTFSLISNMEFLNDRYLSFMYSWDLNGKLFNRVPLLNRLKCREYLGCNVLWGYTTDKNNPASSNYTDSRLFYFPGEYKADGTFQPISFVMDKNTPYVEATVGVHNIFKILQVELTRRLTYLDNPYASKWGVRFMFQMSF